MREVIIFRVLKMLNDYSIQGSMVLITSQPSKLQFFAGMKSEQGESQSACQRALLLNNMDE